MRDLSMKDVKFIESILDSLKMDYLAICYNRGWYFKNNDDCILVDEGLTILADELTKNSGILDSTGISTFVSILDKYSIKSGYFTCYKGIASILGEFGFEFCSCNEITADGSTKGIGPFSFSGDSFIVCFKDSKGEEFKLSGYLGGLDSEVTGELSSVYNHSIYFSSGMYKVTGDILYFLDNYKKKFLEVLR